jgi:hypothetical protein
MKPKEIEIEITRLIQTQPYESYQIRISETLILEEKDSSSKVRSKKLKELMKSLDEKEVEVRKKYKSKKEK